MPSRGGRDRVEEWLVQSPPPSTPRRSARRNPIVKGEEPRRNSTTSRRDSGRGSSKAPTVTGSVRRNSNTAGRSGRGSSTAVIGGSRNPTAEPVPRTSVRLRKKAQKRAAAASAASVRSSSLRGRGGKGSSQPVAAKRARRTVQDEEYEVEAILEVQTLKVFKVKWKGYPASRATWEPEQNLQNCKDLIKIFERRATRMMAGAHPAPAPKPGRNTRSIPRPRPTRSH